MGASGEFVRDTRYLNGRITADGRDGTFLAEAGRYRLVVARACPWANRTMIVRRLLGLEDALSMGICGPEHDWRSWTFDLDPGGVDPVLGIHLLRDAYEKAVPGYHRGVTVPAIVEVAHGAVVTATVPRWTWSTSGRHSTGRVRPNCTRTGCRTRSRRSAPESTRTSS